MFLDLKTCKYVLFRETGSCIAPEEGDCSSVTSMFHPDSAANLLPPLHCPPPLVWPECPSHSADTNERFQSVFEDINVRQWSALHIRRDNFIRTIWDKITVFSEEHQSLWVENIEHTFHGKTYGAHLRKTSWKVLVDSLAHKFHKTLRRLIRIRQMNIILN